MKNLKFLKAIKEYIEMCLSEIMNSDGKFSLGLRYAFVEVLELIQSMLSASERAEIGLDYCIEDVYPLE